MSKNKNLHSAKKQKNDEFYTQYDDIKKEVERYADQLKDKIIYCNCDNEESNFYKYFQDNFDILGLKKLIYFNGDFRSEESIELLKQSDIVITNPPFSYFIKYIAQLMEYDKKFLVIGNMNAITYKDIFRLIKDNKIWFGHSIHSGDREFQVPDSYPLNSAGYRIDEKGKKYIRVKGVRWFTNLDNRKPHIDLIKDVLHKKYTPEEYPKYDNYDAINVDKVKDIPMDYYGYMGVPITYLFKHNPDQFEIIDINPHFFTIVEQGLPKPKQLKLEGRKDPYARIIIKRK